jgi:hypothetical protein
VCPILLIASHTPAANKLCGHFSSYSEGVKNLICFCDVSFSDLDSHCSKCKKQTGSDFILFAEWELCDGYGIVEVSGGLESLFVLEIGSKRIAVHLSYSDWPSCFTDTCYV